MGQLIDRLWLLRISLMRAIAAVIRHWEPFPRQMEVLGFKYLRRPSALWTLPKCNDRLAHKSLLCQTRKLYTFLSAPEDRKSGCNSLRCPVVIPLKAFHLLVSDSGNQQLPAAARPRGMCSCFDGPLGAPLTFPNEGH
ncbi:hypothetical protein CEXT_87841 [Caerostris extrusa]|uniref:Uncharacterized protein n=1 Tax=Caerostris extrusa TaxID=172846 RepID=A0AAV4R0A4_CAEEX|nr:hypothetical protein CEXT_87841 [Caerostris extrusa]